MTKTYTYFEPVWGKKYGEIIGDQQIYVTENWIIDNFFQEYKSRFLKSIKQIRKACLVSDYKEMDCIADFCAVNWAVEYMEN
jgi:hypothetical protein